jgi:hypothetical protein
MIELKGIITPEMATQASARKEAHDAKKLASWALAPGNVPEALMSVAIEVYRETFDSAGNPIKIDDIEMIDAKTRIRNDALPEAYVVSYSECYPDEKFGGKGIFTIVLRNKMKEEYAITAPASTEKPSASRIGQSRYVNTEHIALYSGMGINNSVSAVIPYQTELKLLEEDNTSNGAYHWTKVEVIGTGKTGWIICEYLAVKRPPDKDFKVGGILERIRSLMAAASA